MKCFRELSQIQHLTRHETSQLHLKIEKSLACIYIRYAVVNGVAISYNTLIFIFQETH